MARQAEKQLAKSNLAKVTLLRNASIAVNSLFILVRLLYCYKSTSKKTWFLYIISNVVASMIHRQLSTMGTPKYAADGTLKSSGEDLSQAGLTEYLTDVVYMTWIIYVLVALVTDYAWLLYLAIPVYAGVKGWPLLKPMIIQAQAQARAAAGRNARPQTGQTDETAAELSKRQSKLKARQEKYSTMRVR